MAGGGGQAYSLDSHFYTSFAKGETGTQGRWMAGWGLYRARQYYLGAFQAYNIMRYYDGSVGPRTGLANITPAGSPMGPLLGTGYTAVPGHSIWLAAGRNIYDFSAEDFVYGNPLTTYSGTIGVTSDQPITSVRMPPSKSIICNHGDGTYVLDHANATVTPVTNKATSTAQTPNGNCISWYGGLCWIGGGGNISTIGSRLYFSHALDGTTWNTDQDYIDIGAPNQWEIVGLFSQRTHLLIAKQDGTWWVLNGVPVPSDAAGIGAPSQTGNMVVRQVTEASGFQLGATRGALIGDVVYYVPRWYDIPAMHNGVKTGEVRYLSFNKGVWVEASGANVFPPVFSVSPLSDTLRTPSDCMFTGQGGQALISKDGVWTKHLFFANLTNAPGTWAVNDSTFTVLSDGGIAPNPINFYAWDSSWDRPPDGSRLHPVQDGAIGIPGQNSNENSFYLPEWLDRSGGQVVVDRVEVDFVKYPVANTTDTNHFEFTVTATRLYGTPNAPNANNGVRTGNIYAWDEAPNVPPAGGIQDTMHFFMGEQGRGGGYQIQFANLRGVAIQRVQVTVHSATDLQ
ncbi:MAG: hypothetical protein ACRD6B_03875 [Bryobacteraceae bacterium]